MRVSCGDLSEAQELAHVEGMLEHACECKKKSSSKAEALDRCARIVPHVLSSTLFVKQ